jgi:acyl-CoA thioesterase-1
MKIRIFFFVCLFLSQVTMAQVADRKTYLADIQTIMKTEWPKNRTINLVFHGHSVPAGYFKTPTVNTLGAYPFQVLQALKNNYPLAVINLINTSIGGENSINGAKRFDEEVLVHRPDVLFIDYALNDRGPGLEKAKAAWEDMIQKALAKNIKVILLTASPDQRVPISDTASILDQHGEQIKALAEKYHVAFVDSYGLFRDQVNQGVPLPDLMSQVNHPNEKGHALIGYSILQFFKP